MCLDLCLDLLLDLFLDLQHEQHDSGLAFLPMQIPTATPIIRSSKRPMVTPTIDSITVGSEPVSGSRVVGCVAGCVVGCVAGCVVGCVAGWVPVVACAVASVGSVVASIVTSVVASKCCGTLATLGSLLTVSNR